MINYIKEVVKEIDSVTPIKRDCFSYIAYFYKVTAKLGDFFFEEGEEEISKFCTDEVKEFLKNSKNEQWMFLICPCGEIVESDYLDVNNCSSCKTACCRHCCKRYSLEDLKYGVCENCFDLGTIPKYGEKWFPFEELIKVGDEYFMYSFISGHGSSSFSKLEGAKNGKYVGFELELYHDRIEEFCANLPENFHAEEDSSLDESSAEIISNYGELEQILELVDKLDLSECRILNEDYGLHVHLSNKDDLTNAKFLTFWNNPQNKEWLVKESGRENDGYAAYNDNLILKNENCKDIELLLEYNECGDVVVVHEKTVEVRGFLGTTDKELLKRRIKLAYDIYEFCEEVNLEDLLVENFLEWSNENCLC